MDGVQEIIATLPKPAAIDRSELEESEEKYQAALEELTTEEAEIDELNAKIGKLEECKDREQVKAVSREFSDEDDEFDALCEAAKSALHRLCTGTQIALFRDSNFQSFRPDDDEWCSMKEAIDRSEVFDLGDGFCRANGEHPKVGKTVTEIEKLRVFVREKQFDDTSSLIASFEEEHEIPLDLSNKEFWGECLVPV